MFRKLLNVGKGHSIDKLQQQQQQQQQKKDLFQLNEIRSYGFSYLCCLGYSPSLSLLAVGSKHGLLRVLGNSSVEFSHQLESHSAIRQIEFVDCRPSGAADSIGKSKKSPNTTTATSTNKTTCKGDSTSAKIVVRTDSGELHLLHLKTVREQNYADNTTQTDGASPDCCRNNANSNNNNDEAHAPAEPKAASEYTRLELVARLDYFRVKPEEEDRSKRVTTMEMSADGASVFVGTEGGNMYIVPLDKFQSAAAINELQQEQQVQGQQQDSKVTTNGDKVGPAKGNAEEEELHEEEATAVNLNDEPQIGAEELAGAGAEAFATVNFEQHVLGQLGEEVKSKKQGPIESIKRHPAGEGRLLISYQRGLNVIYRLEAAQVDKYFYNNQVIESSCFAGDPGGDFFYSSHKDGSYIKWDTRLGSQAKANEDFLGQLYGPYPCKPTPKIQACTGLLNDQLESLVVFSGGMPRATYDDKNPVTIVKAEADGKDTIKCVLDFTSKVLDFVVITRPRGNLGMSTGKQSGGGGGGGGGGGKKNKQKQQQQQQQLQLQQQNQRNSQIAVALAILAEEEFVVIDLLNSESYLEFALPYLNCVHSSAITCNQHYSDVSPGLYNELLAHNKRQLAGKLSANEWPITGGRVTEEPELRSHDILLTGHEDGSVNFWDVSGLAMRHLLHVATARLFAGADNEPLEAAGEEAGEPTAAAAAADDDDQHAMDTSKESEAGSSWPPLKRVGRFDPYSDDARLAVRRISLCPQSGTMVLAGTGGQVLVYELPSHDHHQAPDSEQAAGQALQAHEITIVSDQRFTWKGHKRLTARPGLHRPPAAGYRLSSYVQLEPPVAATALDLRADWHLYALGTSYGFLLYDYASKHSVVSKCTLNVQDFSIVSGDSTGTMSRKKSFRKSLRESFRRLRRGRSQRNQQPASAQQDQAPAGQGPPARAAFSRLTTGVRTLGAPAPPGSASNSNLAAGQQQQQQQPAMHRNVYSAERQVEQKVELSSIVRCVTLTSAVITNNSSFTPSLWVGTNAGQVLVYAISLASPAPALAASEEPSEVSEPTEPEPSSSVSLSAPASQPGPAPAAAKLAKEIQLKHRAPIIAIFTSPDEPAGQPQQQAQDDKLAQPEPDQAAKTAAEPEQAAADEPTSSSTDNNDDDQRAQSPAGQQQPPADRSPAAAGKRAAEDRPGQPQVQPRVLICSEEQFKVFNLPNLKPFCKFKLTANEGLRAKKISITQFIKPSGASSSVAATAAAAAAATINGASSGSSTAPLGASKSLQSFATQTSRPGSPAPLLLEQQSADSNHANGAANKLAASENNNSQSRLNNNYHSPATGQPNKEIMNAKFGKPSASDKLSQLQALAGGAGEPLAGGEAAAFEHYMVCMSNQGDCAIYSVPDLKRQAQIQVCKCDDVNGITSTMLTNYGEGFYLKSSSNFLRFSISSQRVLRVLSVV